MWYGFSRPRKSKTKPTMMPSLLFFLAVLLLAASFAQEDTCTWKDASCYQDPNLKEISVQFDDGRKEPFLAYFPPDVSTFYREEPGTRKPVQPYFNGQFGKFINMSPNPIRIDWVAGGNREDVYIADAAPFGAAATATFPGHHFAVKSKTDTSVKLHDWHMTPGIVLYVYDPFEKGEMKLDDLTENELELYKLQKDNLKFAEQYKAATGRDYLSLYPRRHRPLHSIWSADYFGQEHNVLTKETHFIELPPPENLVKLSPQSRNEPMLKDYRAKDDYLNMTLKVLSCAPRVFEIRNFLSKVEIDHVMQIAHGITLHQSSTKAGQDGEHRLDKETRTSMNSWLDRGRSPILDAIYRRSADLMQIDEAYLRYRSAGEMPHLQGRQANAEHLQLVHYANGQQYTAHHDFAIPKPVDGQPMRFATILLYLNEGMKGGETTFPRWLNAEDPDELKVVPEIGKAVLFYSLLPDGNPDDLSQHAAKPVTDGEKWLVNLWTWDPMMRQF